MAQNIKDVMSKPSNKGDNLSYNSYRKANKNTVGNRDKRRASVRSALSKGYGEDTF